MVLAKIKMNIPNNNHHKSKLKSPLGFIGMNESLHNNTFVNAENKGDISIHT